MKKTKQDLAMEVLDARHKEYMKGENFNMANFIAGIKEEIIAKYEKD